MNFPARITPLLVAGVMLIGTVACQPKLSEAARQAKEAAESADQRVKALEQELADIRAKREKGNDDHKHVSRSEEKALERLVADAKRRSATRRQEAEQLVKAPAAPRSVVVEVPAGTKLVVKLSKDLSTQTCQPGDPWEGTLVESVVAEGRTIWPEGTPVGGVVTQSTPAGRLQSGQGGLGLRLNTVGQYDVDGGTHLTVGSKRGERNTKFIAGGAALGALAGILSDSKNKGDHALGGAALGAAAGTALAAGTADTVIKVPAAQPISFTLGSPEKVTLRP